MSKMNRILGAILVLAVLAGMVTLGQRHRIDEKNKQVQLIMDFRDLKDRQDLWQQPLNEYLRKLEEAGLEAVAVSEMTLEELVRRGEVSVKTGRELLEQERYSAEESPLPIDRIKEDRVYVTADDQELLAWIQTELSKRWGSHRVELIETSQRSFLMVRGTRSSLLQRRLGFFPSDMSLIADTGLDIIPLFHHYEWVTEEHIKETFAFLQEHGNISGVIFESRTVLGYPNRIETTADEIKKREAVFGIIQPGDTLLGSVPLNGMERLLDLVSNNAARVYWVSRGITDNTVPPDMILRWMNSIEEFNVRMLLLRPFYSQTREETAADRNIHYVRSLKATVEEAGYQTGPVGPLPDVKVHPAAVLLLMMGIAAGAVLLLRHFAHVPMGWVLGFLGVGFFCGLLIIYTDQPSVIRNPVALFGSIVFPALAIAALLKNPWLTAGKTKNRVAHVLAGARFWLSACLVTLMGAVIVVALISDTRYVLEVDYFRGVKVLYTVPLVIVAATYSWFSVYSQEKGVSFASGIKTFFGRRITVADAALAVVIGAVFLFYLERTGTVAISDFEWTARNLLDQVLIIRPRLKEFLIGHPLLILAVAASVRGVRQGLILLFTAGAVGQLSMMNTFVHIKTPLMNSIIRTANGLWLGLLIGVAVVLLGNQCLLWWERKTGAGN